MTFDRGKYTILIILSPFAYPGCEEDDFFVSKNSGNVAMWAADVGLCVNDYNPKCEENGRGKRVQVRISPLSGGSENPGNFFILQVLDIQGIKVGFPPYYMPVGTIERLDLKQNFIWPICLFNKGNHLIDSEQTIDYQAYKIGASIFLIRIL
jgi:hypothetical protein